MSPLATETTESQSAEGTGASGASGATGASASTGTSDASGSTVAQDPDAATVSSVGNQVDGALAPKGHDVGTNGAQDETRAVAGEELTSAMQFLANGKRALLISDTSNAVSSLESACQLLGQHYGESAVECGEAYFYYGKALLELARMESGVLDNVMDGDESEPSTADEDEHEVKVEESVGKGSDVTDSSTKDSDKVRDADSIRDEGDENESIASNEAGTSDIKEQSDKSAVDNEEEDDPSNLQLAWEIMELAKNCFQRQADSLEAENPQRMELEHRLSETYLILGEVSVENENYQQAIEDLSCCLRRRQELMPEDSRCIAETHYQLGVAQGFNLEFDKAIASLHDAIAVLEKRIDNLKNSKESSDSSKKPDVFYTREREIKEIESLIPEIKEKIADTKDMQNETVKKLGDRALMEEKEMETSYAMKVETVQNTFDAASTASTLSSKLTSDISHMLKKRKKSDDGSAISKKACLD